MFFTEYIIKFNLLINYQATYTRFCHLKTVLFFIKLGTY